MSLVNAMARISSRRIESCQACDGRGKWLTTDKAGHVTGWACLTCHYIGVLPRPGWTIRTVRSAGRTR